MVDVTGGYDEAIEQYGESKGETNHLQSNQHFPKEENKIDSIVRTTNDYIVDPKQLEPNRTSEFIRASNSTNTGNNLESMKALASKKLILLNFGMNPYAINHEKQKSISRIKSAPRYPNNFNPITNSQQRL